MGLELTGTLPFGTVLLHSLVRDKEGRKMTKSRGNVIDPLDIIDGCSLESMQERLDAGNLAEDEVARAKANNKVEFPQGIPECGSDALRFGLLTYTAQGGDMNMDVKIIVGYRMFCNKLWQAMRFALRYLADFQPGKSMLLMKWNALSLSSTGAARSNEIRDRYILSRLANTTETMNKSFATYKLGDAQQAIYSYWIDDLCDTYLELAKPVLYDESGTNKDARYIAQTTLWLALEGGLRLLHPMMPFVTEELWQRMPGRGTGGETEPESIMLARYPEHLGDWKDDTAEASMAETIQIIRACRSLKASYNTPNNKETAVFYLKTKGPTITAAALNQTRDIQTLGKASALYVNATPDSELPISAGTLIVDDHLTVLLDLNGLVDSEMELTRLEKTLRTTDERLALRKLKMAREGYHENVPRSVQNETWKS
ncbi:hypothetical protein ACA910_022622 [Epithemia clementina (nom. ined.)]